MLTAGAKLGAHQIVALIGSGGMGEVYQAHDTKLGRDVAIKVLPEAFAHDPQRLSRFQREAKLLASLNHPNIATIHGLEESNGTHYLVMELVHGESLAEKLKSGALAEKEVAGLGGQIAEALEEAHEHQVVHRDLKPANVMVTAKGRVKVLDFGVARLLRPNDETIHTLSVPGTQGVVGTLPYMAPEQLLGEPTDARTDLWALGAVLYETAIGRKPFDEQLSSRLIDAILHRPPVAPRELNGRLSPELERIILKCLEKSPEDRYQSAKEIAVDLRRMGTASVAVATPSRQHRRWLRWQIVGIAAAAALVTLAIAGAVVVYLRPGRPASRAEWVQLTHFPDSVAQPSLSADGRMLTFVRGPGSFATLGQIYVKILPDGEPKQLTADNLQKMSPVFSPDGSRIAYTARGQNNSWDTWEVPVLGGEPRQWLPNASGLAWNGKKDVLFSEVFDRVEGNHMKIVAAEESRAGERDVYVPQPRGAMAHRSFPSPDGKWVMLAEMSDRGDWLACRLVPMDGSSSGRPVGPPGAPCWFSAWSPDGRWIYFSSGAGGTFHIWRQRFSESRTLAKPEQITSGPTSEEGIAMAPDGRSFITAVGLTQSGVWVHDSRGERQISLEGYASQPQFSPDGKILFYVTLNNASNELWFADLNSGRAEPVLPNFPIGSSIRSAAYDISPDGRQVAFSAPDREGKQRVWLAPVDRRSPPRPISNVEGDGPKFAPGGEIFFRGREGTYGFAYRVRLDGTGLRKAIEHPVIQTMAVSPDAQWLVVYSRLNEEQPGAALAYPLGGGPPIHVPGNSVRWSWDGKLLFLSVGVTGYSGIAGRTYVLSLPPGQVWPKMPEGGFQSEEEVAKLPRVRVIDTPDAAPGPTPEVYAFSREAVQRNLYRIPIP